MKYIYTKKLNIFWKTLRGKRSQTTVNSYKGDIVPKLIYSEPDK